MPTNKLKWAFRTLRLLAILVGGGGLLTAIAVNYSPDYSDARSHALVFFILLITAGVSGFLLVIARALEEHKRWAYCAALGFMILASPLLCGAKGFLELLRVKEQYQASTPYLIRMGYVLGLIIVGTVSFLMATEVFYSRKISFARFNNSSVVREKLQACRRKADTKCLEAAYQRLLELEPEDISVKANYAFILTELKRFEKAEVLYQELLAVGEGTYDLMAYYARNLAGLNKKEEALKWYENALSLNPALVDITEELAKLLFTTHRPFEAVSLLESFISEYPNSRGTLQGHLVSMRENLANARPLRKTAPGKLRLLAAANAHHRLPILVPHQAKPMTFLVDTGATLTMMNAKSFQEAYPELVERAEPTLFVMADGRRLRARSVRVPYLRVGPWQMTNIRVGFCPSCENLAGQSLLQKFTIRIYPKGEINVLEMQPN